MHENSCTYSGGEHCSSRFHRVFRLIGEHSFEQIGSRTRGVNQNDSGTRSQVVAVTTSVLIMILKRGEDGNYVK